MNEEKYILLKDLTLAQRARTTYYINKGSMKKFKTPLGVAIDDTPENRERILTPFAQKQHTEKIDLGNYNSKDKVWFKMVTELDDSTRASVYMKANKYKRYTANNGGVYIDLKEMITPQVNLIARRTKIPADDIFTAINNLLVRYQK